LKKRRGRLRSRQPAVAGQFYSSDPDELKKEIESCFSHPLGPGTQSSWKTIHEGVVATINPHAGYVYSGPVAAHSFRLISSQPAGLFIIIGPNHYGIGSGVATPQSDEWMTPLGSVSVDVAAARELMKESRMVDMDDSAHWREHSIEVQVPFLQYTVGSGFKILPISVAMQDMETCVHLGRCIAAFASSRQAMLIASTDMTHYEPHDKAVSKDRKALDLILSFDVEGLYRYIDDADLTMCGYGPVAAVMTASKLLGAKRAELLSYATSGQTGGDTSSVVGYSSVAFFK
jgi:AmmeMemoRadiSam system protein B